MWRGRKTELEQFKSHPGVAKDFLRSVDTHLYQTSLGEPEAITDLYLEQDPHHSDDDFDTYLLTACENGNFDKRLPFPVLVLNIMEELLRGLTVFTEVQETPVPLLVVAELANYCVSPHMFSAAYARFYNSHPTDGERVFFNGCDSLVTVTSGVNRALLETLYMTPGYDFTLSALQSGVAGNAAVGLVSDYDQAKQALSEKNHVWMNYYWSQLIIGIQREKDGEQQLISKLRLFCQKRGIELHILWPYEKE